MKPVCRIMMVAQHRAISSSQRVDSGPRSADQKNTMLVPFEAMGQSTLEGVKSTCAHLEPSGETS
jgi:hypothetical protein